VDVWARDLPDLDSITSQLVLQLRADEFYLTVDHPIPMGERLVLTQFKGMAENSNVNPETEDKRTLRRTFSYVVHGWIVHEPIDANIIERITIDFYDNTDTLDPQFLERVIITEDGINAEGDNVGTINTSLYGVLIVGEAEVSEEYGNFVVPANATILGMQATVLGRVPTGDDLELRLTLDGVEDTARNVVIPAGERYKAVVFGDELPVVAGNVLGVSCASVGSVDPGDWIEVRFSAEIEVNPV